MLGIKTETLQQNYEENKAVSALNEAMQAVDSEDKIFASMSADELIQLASRGMDEIELLRGVNMKKMAEGRKHFTALIDQLQVSEKDLYRRQIMYTAILSTVIDEDIDETKLPRHWAKEQDDPTGGAV